jgi:hypothetical protein
MDQLEVGKTATFQFIALDEAGNDIVATFAPAISDTVNGSLTETGPDTVSVTAVTAATEVDLECTATGPNGETISITDVEDLNGNKAPAPVYALSFVGAIVHTLTKLIAKRLT